MPIYEHQCKACDYIWEDIFKMDAPIPRKCPDCGKRGKVKRLVSLCAGRVELTGHELRQHLRAEGKKLAKEAQKSEDLAANIVGEEKYHKNELARTKQ